MKKVGGSVRRPFSDQDIKMVKEYLEGKKTYQEIADKYNISRNSISYKVKKYREMMAYGQPLQKAKEENSQKSSQIKRDRRTRKTQPLKAESLAIVKEYLETDQSYLEVALRHGVKPSTLQYWVNKYRDFMAQQLEEEKKQREGESTSEKE